MKAIQRDYNCKFGDAIQSFVEQKRMLGYPYVSSARILAVFDAFVCEHFPTDTTLTKEIGSITFSVGLEKASSRRELRGPEDLKMIV